MMTLSRLVYVSTASPALDLTAIESICAIANTRNSASGVTGLLVYNGANFMQLLEGPQDNVDAVFESIRRDPRHHGVVRLLAEPAEGRVCSRWAMAAQAISLPGRRSEGMSAFAIDTPALDERYLCDMPQTLRGLFQSFNTMSVGRVAS
ncbi:BLUF domain-containing protein [Maricaulaceae bacterium MS644]